MTAIKAMIIAFSIYSKIPVPIFNWEEKEMKYQLIFFPWIGAIIGALMVGWNHLSNMFNLGIVSYTLIAAAIPVIIT
ncbi:MAG: adenosylcobinamide-GDP ribazoletransferase, partial [Lachnospiraceae bacterium]|nr:adenosylcobinamide-GDP ribazoletransferase [Lachnospiraceae bacterium]